MARVILTGASGFTGQYVAAELQANGYEVHAFCRNIDDSLSIPVNVCPHIAPLEDKVLLARAVEAVQPSAVIHLAAISFVAHENIDDMYCTNVIGTRNLLEALSNSRSPMSCIVLASSANLYGNAASGVICESAPVLPTNDYGISKMAMEHIARIFSDRLPITITRPFNYTGRGQSAKFLLPKIVDHVRRRAPVIELGNLDVERDWSDVRTVARIYCDLIRCPQAIGGTFNICSGRVVSLRYVVEAACRIGAHAMGIRVNPDFVRPHEVKTLCGDISRLRAVLGDVSMPPIEHTIAWMLDA